MPVRSRGYLRFREARRATRSDLWQACHLLNHFWPEAGARFAPGFFRDAAVYVWVPEGRVLGCVAVRRRLLETARRTSWVGLVSYLCVHPEVRGLGVAAALVHTVGRSVPADWFLFERDVTADPRSWLPPKFGTLAVWYWVSTEGCAAAVPVSLRETAKRAYLAEGSRPDWARVLPVGLESAWFPDGRAILEPTPEPGAWRLCWIGADCRALGLPSWIRVVYVPSRYRAHPWVAALRPRWGWASWQMTHPGARAEAASLW